MNDSKEAMKPPRETPRLKRALNLPLMTLYGLGTTIGAGIFVLIGEVTAVAGAFTPWAFICAAILTGFSALSFAELCARYPKSAGEAVYVYEGLKSRGISTLTGILVAAVGITSSAAITVGSVGYLQEFIGLPPAILILLVILVIGSAAAWGIQESVTIAAALTLLEIGALIAVIWGGRDIIVSLDTRWRELVPGFGMSEAVYILSGSILAFYAFVGFEDMVNVAEEVNDPQRTMPRAIVLTLIVTMLLYGGVSIVATLGLPAEQLAGSPAPMAYIFRETTGASSTTISLIGIFAVLNGALIQIIMVSRVLYGLANRGQLPEILARIDPRTQTPLYATILTTLVVLCLALWFPLVMLARTTSATVLVIFAFVNLSLWRLKRSPPANSSIFVVPRWVPGLGFLISAALAVLQFSVFM